MKPTLRLRRRLRVERWHIAARIGLSMKREWEQAVLRLACDEGTVDVARVAEHLLDGRTPIAQRLLQSCVARRLLDDAGGVLRPTADGQRTAETGEVFVADEGTWSLDWCDDVLLGTQVLAIEPREDARTRDEVLARKDRQLPARELIPMPAQLKRLDGARHDVVLGRHPRVQFERLLGVVERGLDDAELFVEIELRPDLVRGRVRGQIDGERVEVAVPHVGIDHATAWTAILDAAGQTERWDAEREVLRVRFDKLDEQERGTFSTSLVAKAPRTAAHGTFDDARVDGVAIAPASEHDAAAWAIWRLRRDARGIATTERYARWSARAAEPFDPRPTVPSRGDLARDSRGEGRPEPMYWSLQAPEDWHL